MKVLLFPLPLSLKRRRRRNFFRRRTKKMSSLATLSTLIDHRSNDSKCPSLSSGRLSTATLHISRACSLLDCGAAEMKGVYFGRHRKRALSRCLIEFDHSRKLTSTSCNLLLSLTTSPPPPPPQPPAHQGDARQAEHALAGSDPGLLQTRERE